jgi:hypothetical protein
MRLLLFLFLYLPCVAAAQFTDDFESGNLDGWTQTPAGAWSAASITGRLSGNFSLRHTPDVSSTGTYRDRISMPIETFPLTEGNTVWRFLMRYNYNPTATNKWAVLLMSDTDATHWSSLGDYKGYAVGVNLPASTTNKILCLYEIRDGYKEIINTGINWYTDVGTSATTTVAIEIRRSAAGEWRFYWAKTGKFEDLQEVGTAVTNVQYTAANYFGAINEYTSASAGAQKFWLDNITIFSSVFPAKISAAVQQERNKIRVSFTQNVNAATVGDVTNYTLTGASFTLAPVLAEVVNAKEILLTF